MRRKPGRQPKTKKKGLHKKMYDKLFGRTPLKAKKGGMAKSSAQTSVIKGASVGGSREGSVIKGPASKGSREGSVIKASKGTHVTKDGRVAKKGLYYYMNRRKKAGTSRPGKGTVSSKALKKSARTAKR